MNNAPFKVGDKVVALKSSGIKFGAQVFKNQVYTVEVVIECTCGQWWVGLKGVLANIEITNEKHCHLTPTTRHVIGQSKYFALVQPRHEDAAIDEAIIEQARELIRVSETVAPVGEPVNN